MRSARSLYRLNALIAALGGLAVLAALVVALRAVRFETGSVDAFVTVCRQMVVPQDLTMLAVLTMGTVSLATLGLVVRSVLSRACAHRRFTATIEEIDRLAIDGVDVVLIDDELPQAFCAGLRRPRVHLSTGALVALGDDELRAVVAHEHHHQTRRDPLRIFAAGVLSEALFFLPVLRRLRQRYAELAELAADEAAVDHVGGRQPLASALLAFGEREHPAEVVGIAPERVDQLLGKQARWEVPVSLVLGGFLTIGGLVAIALGTASAASPGTMALPAMVAGACSLAMTAAPAMLGGALLVLTTRRLRARD